MKGLTEEEVKTSREQYGTNAIPDSEPTTFWDEFKETFSDPMIKVLLGIAVLMLIMFFFGYADPVIYDLYTKLLLVFLNSSYSIGKDRCSK